MDALLERDEQLGVLDELLAATASGGRIALVSGEAGVGKSVLVGAFARRAGRRAHVVWGACDPLVTPRALGPLHDIGRQLGGALAGSLAADAPREVVFAALLDAVERPGPGPRPVVVIEDVHWADEATLDLLMFLGRRLARSRALVVVTYRDDEVGPEHPLPGVLATLPVRVATRVPLHPLSAAGVAELARVAGRSATGVHEVTGGNPLLVTELLAAREAGVPPTVRDLVLARLRALPEPARAAARLLAVIPGRAGRPILAGLADEALTAGIEGGLLAAAGDGVAYRHELIRLAVEGSLSPVRLAELHAQVLATLEAAGADAARLVHHARNAGDIDALLRHAPVAARQAAAVFSHREAVGYVRAALPHADRLPARDRAELFESFAISAQRAGFGEEGLPVMQRALELWEELGDQLRVGVALRWVSRLSWWTGRVPQSYAATARSVEVLERLPPGRELAMAYSNRSARHMLANEPAAAVEWGERAIALAERLGDAETAVDALINVASARMNHLGGNGAELLAAHEKAVAAGLADQATRALVNLASTALQNDEWAVAVELVDRALAVALDRDLHGYARYKLGNRSRLRLQLGDWAGARLDAEQSLDWPGPARNSQVPGLVALGQLKSRCGEPGAMSTLDEAAAYAYPMGELQWVCPVADARSEYLWLAGDLDGAAAEAARWLPLAAQRYHSHAGHLAHRLWLADPTASIPAGIESPWTLLIAGDWAGAAQEWERRGGRYAKAEALIHGDEEAAAAALRFVDGLGATAVAARWRAALRARGVRVGRGPRAATARNPAGLTPRQAEVLGLVAEGLTNAQIAQRLSMSVKTVGHHVSAVLDKLGANTRGQAAAAAHRLGLTGA